MKLLMGSVYFKVQIIEGIQLVVRSIGCTFFVGWGGRGIKSRGKVLGLRERDRQVQWVVEEQIVFFRLQRVYFVRLFFDEFRLVQEWFLEVKDILFEGWVGVRFIVFLFSQFFIYQVVCFFVVVFGEFFGIIGREGVGVFGVFFIWVVMGSYLQTRSGKG